MHPQRNENVSNLGYYHYAYRYQSMDALHKKMHGIRRVIIFCILTTVLPILLLILPLYLRHKAYADVTYAVTESDILEINDGVSSIFCSAHSIKMNETFNAFQVSRRPETTSYRKHIRLKKSMRLPDDTLEYWGFYLLKGATVALSVCSRYEGASILVVRGERNLRTCGLLEHNRNKARAKGIFLPEAEEHVKITFESNAQEIYSEEAKNETNLESPLPKKLSFKKSYYANTKKNAENLQHNINHPEKNIAEIEKQKKKDATRKMRHTNKRLLKLHKRKNNRTETKHHFHNKLSHNDSTLKDNIEVQNLKEKRIHRLEAELHAEKPDTADEEIDENRHFISNRRHKRYQEAVNPSELLDQGIRHGGNAAKNETFKDEDSSISSFEDGLFTCYNGQVLLAQEFNASEYCNDVSHLVNGKHMQTRHDVVEPGYYYYIFYSDNDFFSNDIHAVFDIYKPTLQYENVTQACINKTECNFALTMMSSDRVIVEVRTKDGIDDEVDDISLLISTCHPRMGIYIIFPVTVLLLILGCAFV